MTENTVQAVPADKLPANVIMEQLGYAPRQTHKRKVRQIRVERTADVKTTSNGRYIAAFDTFWANVRSISGLKVDRRNSRHKRTKSVPINGRTAPIGPIHRGAKNADATHLLVNLGKGK